MTLKTTMLIALTAAARSSGFHHSNSVMVVADSYITFLYNKLHNSWRKGQRSPVITFVNFQMIMMYVSLKLLKVTLKDQLDGGETINLLSYFSAM